MKLEPRVKHLHHISFEEGTALTRLALSRASSSCFHSELYSDPHASFALDLNLRFPLILLLRVTHSVS